MSATLHMPQPGSGPGHQPHASGPCQGGGLRSHKHDWAAHHANVPGNPTSPSQKRRQGRTSWRRSRTCRRDGHMRWEFSYGICAKSTTIQPCEGGGGEGDDWAFGLDLASHRHNKQCLHGHAHYLQTRFSADPCRFSSDRHHTK